MQVSPLEGHRIWSETYDRQLNPLLALERRILAEDIGPLHGKHCVDVGCGTGRWMTYLQSHGAHVTGVDVSREMLLEAARKPRLAGSLVLGEAGFLPLADAASDLTLCSFALAYMSDPAAVIREMARIAAPRSRVVIADLHPRALRAGWTRSFRTGGSVYEIESFAHSTADLLAAGRAAGLREQACIEAQFGEPERAIFLSAGKGHLFSEMSRIPAVWIVVWTKP
jgi:malonyl-CoA O-methyltransferase